MNTTLIISDRFKNVLPPLTEIEYSGLETNIITNGCLDAITVTGSVIIDGHNRYAICKKHGVTFVTRSMSFGNEDEAEIWIREYAADRRNLSDFAILENQSELKALLEKQGKENLKVFKGNQYVATLSTNDKTAKHDTRKEIAKKTKLSTGKVAQFNVIKDKVDDTTKEQLRSGEKTIGEVYAAVKRETTRKEVSTKLSKIAASQPQTPTGKFDVIVIDPPWPIQKIERDVAPTQVALDYPVMSIEEIKALPLVQDFAAKDCHLFLWTTQKYLPDSFDILNKWGVKYVFTMVWHKNGGFQPFNLPQYNCEFVLYGKIGNPQFLETKNFFTCFDANRTKHSEKPEEFYKLLNRITGGRKLDIFNRRKIDGFVGYGNEAKA